MSLYNIMNKEEEAPERKVFPVVEDEPIAPVAEQPVAVQPAEDKPVAEEAPKYVYTHWWQTPNYLEEQAKLESATKKRMEQDEQRARNDRNMAIIGDIAKLGAQAFASAGGATKIEKSAPASALANEKLQAIRDRNALQIENFAKQRMAARQAMVEDNNKRGQLEASLAEADAERARRAATEKANQDYRERMLKNEEERIAIAKQNADTAAQNAETRANNAVKGYRAYDKDGNVHYFETKGSAEWFAQQEGTYVENPVEEVTVTNGVDRYGDPVTTTVTRTSTKGGHSQKPGEKKKNPMGSGKKANPMS